MMKIHAKDGKHNVLLQGKVRLHWGGVAKAPLAGEVTGGGSASASSRDNSNKETACINAPAGALGVVTDTLKDGTPVALLPSAPQWLQRTSAVSEDPVSGGQTHTADRQTDPCGASFWRAHSLHSSVMFAHHIGASVESLLTGCEPKLRSIQAALFPLHCCNTLQQRKRICQLLGNTTTKQLLQVCPKFGTSKKCPQSLCRNWCKFHTASKRPFCVDLHAQTAPRVLLSLSSWRARARLHHVLP